VDVIFLTSPQESVNLLHLVVRCRTRKDFTTGVNAFVKDLTHAHFGFLNFLRDLQYS
jgi:hypothetical protein